LIRRLSGYWRMEAGNVLLVPLIAAVAVIAQGDSLSVPLAFAAFACSALLVVGAIAWKIELDGLMGDTRLADRTLPWLERARMPTLVMAVLAPGAAVVEYAMDGRWTASAIATAILALLALLEWVNYYKVQLQHFDHAADFKRLLAGRGFREAHLAKALRLRRARNLSAAGRSPR
jgi:hypothetical protein